MGQQQSFRVRETLLSQKPRENSALIAFAGVLVILVVTLLCWKEGDTTYRLLAAAPERVFHGGEYWRLLTAMGVHADLKHFLSNAVLFFFFAYLLYGYFGGLVFPLLTLLLGSLVNYLSLMTYAEGIHLVGASGLVYLMAGFWLTMYVLVERRLALKKRLLRSVGVGLIVLMPAVLQPSVSYRTHAIGFFTGVTAGIICFWAGKRRIRAAEVITPDDSEEIVA